jgi:ribosomal protein S18 acetylase RimI-like enzyme
VDAVAGIALRRTTSADLDFVLALEHHPDQAPFIGQWTRDEHLATIERADREHLIIEAAGGPVGYLIGYDVRTAGYGIYIKRIAIAEKSRGIGRAALRAYFAHVGRRFGTRAVWLAVRDHNARAQRAYAAVGFARVDMSSAEFERFLAAVDRPLDRCLIMRASV